MNKNEELSMEVQSLETTDERLFELIANGRISLKVLCQAIQNPNLSQKSLEKLMRKRTIDELISAIESGESIGNEPITIEELRSAFKPGESKDKLLEKLKAAEETRAETMTGMIAQYTVCIPILSELLNRYNEDMINTKNSKIASQLEQNRNLPDNIKEYIRKRQLIPDEIINLYEVNGMPRDEETVEQLSVVIPPKNETAEVIPPQDETVSSETVDLDDMSIEELFKFYQSLKNKKQNSEKSLKVAEESRTKVKHLLKKRLVGGIIQLTAQIDDLKGEISETYKEIDYYTKRLNEL